MYGVPQKVHATRHVHRQIKQNNTIQEIEYAHSYTVETVLDKGTAIILVLQVVLLLLGEAYFPSPSHFNKVSSYRQ